MIRITQALPVAGEVGVRQLMKTAVVVGLITAAGTAAAVPEMRCRLSGAYIRVYGTQGEQREVCERQGGEYTHYYPSQRQSGPAPRQEGFKGNIGQGQNPLGQSQNRRR